MNEIKQFFDERSAAIDAMGRDEELRRKSIDWMLHADAYKYTYNFTWMGRPIIKFPNDMVAQQELVWRTKPDLIIETGIAHGGSIIFSASLLELLGKGRVVGIDVDIRKHNRREIESHPMAKRITMIEGGSTDPSVLSQVQDLAKNAESVMVILDSNHSHRHVLDELQLYSPLVTVGNYIILPDTFIQFFPKGYYSGTRPWDVDNNPWTAMKEFMTTAKDFVHDTTPVSKCMITESFDGYLRRVR
jgi:cephalosporin hydroxylase